MKKEEFLTGLKVFWSCGGVNPDEATLEVWYQVVKDVSREDYEKAILDLIRQTEKPLATLNFPGEIIEISAMHKRERQSIESRKERQLPPKDMIPPEKLNKLVRDFNRKLHERAVDERA